MEIPGISAHITKLIILLLYTSLLFVVSFKIYKAPHKITHPVPVLILDKQHHCRPTHNFQNKLLDFTAGVTNSLLQGEM